MNEFSSSTQGVILLAPQIGRRFPLLSHLSLDQTLHREHKSKSFKSRRRSAKVTLSVKRQLAGLEPWTIGTGASERKPDESSSSDTDSGADVGTTPVGWEALLCLPRGLFSLKVNAVCLGYDSYVLLRAHVAELHCAKVASPSDIEAAVAYSKGAEAAAAKEKRKIAALKRDFGDQWEVEKAAQEERSTAYLASIYEDLARMEAAAATKRATVLADAAASAATAAVALRPRSKKLA